MSNYQNHQPFDKKNPQPFRGQPYYYNGVPNYQPEYMHPEYMQPNYHQSYINYQNYHNLNYQQPVNAPPITPYKTDPRIRKTPSIPSGISPGGLPSPKKVPSPNISSASSDSSQDQEQIYQKTKIITKRRDPILDTPQQIKKWVQARKKNYPSQNKKQLNKKEMQNEMSLLESKIRKKILLITSDSRGMMRKLKNMDILKRLICEGKIEKARFRGGTKNQKLKGSFIKKENIVEEIRVQQKVNKGEGDEKGEGEGDGNDNNNNNEDASEIPIQKTMKIPELEEMPQLQRTIRHQGLQPEDMIKHLKVKQQEDKKFYGELLNYRSNSLNYKYNCKTLEASFLLEDIFQESSYLLQAIRFIVKNEFFDKK